MSLSLSADHGAVESRHRQARNASAPAEELPEEGVYTLPCGYVTDDGVIHSRVELAPVTGREEELLINMQPGVCAASFVTALLSKCVRRVGTIDKIDKALIRDLQVGDRDYLIIKLREMTFGKKVEAVVRCSNPCCGKPMDIAFSVDDIQIDRRPASMRFFTKQLSRGAGHRDREQEGVHQVEFRLPTGKDQEELAAVTAADETAAINRLLARCVRRIDELTEIDESLIANLPDITRHEIEADMQRLAPQVEIEIEISCPECKSTFARGFDFTAFFLSEMKANPKELVWETHFLAWHYHWSEQEILAMTRRKRRRYVALLQDEIDRLNHSQS